MFKAIFVDKLSLHKKFITILIYNKWQGLGFKTPKTILTISHGERTCLNLNAYIHKSLILFLVWKLGDMQWNS